MNSNPGNIKEKKQHSIIIENRKEIRIDGVEEVGSFDEECVNLSTTCGDMTVEGSGLQVGTIDVDRGFMRISGNVSGIYYSDYEQKKHKKFFGVK